MGSWELAHGGPGAELGNVDPQSHCPGQEDRDKGLPTPCWVGDSSVHLTHPRGLCHCHLWAPRPGHRRGMKHMLN